MRVLIAVIALTFMIPIAQAHDDGEQGPEGGPPPSEGGVCIQTIEGPTVCN